MHVYLRYTKGLGNSALAARVRNTAGHFWNFSTLAWVAVEALAVTTYTMEEFADSDPNESAYQHNIILPTVAQAETAFIEVILVSTGEVLAYESIATERSQGTLSTFKFNGTGEVMAVTSEAYRMLIPSLTGAIYSPTIKQGAKLAVIKGDTPTITATLSNNYTGWTVELILSMEEPIVKKVTKTGSWVDITTGSMTVDLTASDTSEVGVYDCAVKVKQGLNKTLTVLQFTMLVLDDE